MEIYALQVHDISTRMKAEGISKAYRRFENREIYFLPLPFCEIRHLNELLQSSHKFKNKSLHDLDKFHFSREDKISKKDKQE